MCCNIDYIHGDKTCSDTKESICLFKQTSKETLIQQLTKTYSQLDFLQFCLDNPTLFIGHYNPTRDCFEIRLSTLTKIKNKKFRNPKELNLI
jgi:hypothetical protein